ncbi:MAG: hypothetical protein R3208_19285 [Ketobacteraceae bacterium]|nr:hypothetical protein [Ketobacteraceae bacterium]
MTFSNTTLVRFFSGLLVVAGLAGASAANAQGDRYDDTAQLITGLAIGAVAGYALIEASEGLQDAHYKENYHHRHHRRHEHHRGCGHDRSYRVYRHDYHHGHGYRHGHNKGHGKGHYKDHHHKKKYRHHDGGHDRHYGRDYHRGERHGVYRIREESHRRHGGSDRRVTVTHF